MTHADVPGASTNLEYVEHSLCIKKLTTIYYNFLQVWFYLDSHFLYKKYDFRFL